jgi:hypothetical protein
MPESPSITMTTRGTDATPIQKRMRLFRLAFNPMPDRLVLTSVRAPVSVAAEATSAGLGMVSSSRCHGFGADTAAEWLA